MMGDLTGWPYNSQFVTGGLVTIILLNVPSGIAACNTSTVLYNQEWTIQKTLNQPIVTGPDGEQENLNAPLNINWLYNVQTWATLPDGISFTAAADDVTGSQLAGGIVLTLTCPPIGTSESLTFNVSNPSGPVGGQQINFGITDAATTGESGEAGEILVATNGTTNSDGTFTYQGSIPFILSDPYLVQWSAAGTQVTGSTQITGQQLQSGFTVDVTLPSTQTVTQQNEVPAFSIGVWAYPSNENWQNQPGGIPLDVELTDESFNTLWSTSGASSSGSSPTIFTVPDTVFYNLPNQMNLLLGVTGGYYQGATFVLPVTIADVTYGVVANFDVGNPP